jgi:hypothetical protein
MAGLLLSVKHTTEIEAETGPSTRIIFKLRHYPMIAAATATGTIASGHRTAAIAVVPPRPEL